MTERSIVASRDGVALAEVLDGDREWLSIRVAAPDAEALIHELWEAASG